MLKQTQWTLGHLKEVEVEHFGFHFWILVHVVFMFGTSGVPNMIERTDAQTDIKIFQLSQRKGVWEPLTIVISFCTNLFLI